MPKVNMTARWVQGVQPTEKQVDYFDTRPGGLILRVSARGVKSWCVMYRHGRRQRRLTLGKYPPLSLADARELAQQALRAVAMGNDPAMQKQARRQALDGWARRLLVIVGEGEPAKVISLRHDV